MFSLATKAASLTIKKPCHFGVVSHEGQHFRYLTPETRNKKPILEECFITPDNVRKKELFL
jgi:hypothetical protein